jgi:cupin 2 domain-containing protein
MIGPSHGRLLEGSAAPTSGERVEPLVQIGDTVIEQILSGELGEPVSYDQDHDEWVVMLEGAAEIEVDGESLPLEPGDWMFLPRRTPHRLVRTSRGTSWLAIHLPDQEPPRKPGDK